MEERKKELEAFEKRKQEHQQKLTATKNELLEAEKTNQSNIDDLKKRLRDLEIEKEKIKKDEEELNKKEKVMEMSCIVI